MFGHHRGDLRHADSLLITPSVVPTELNILSRVNTSMAYMAACRVTSFLRDFVEVNK